MLKKTAFLCCASVILGLAQAGQTLVEFSSLNDSTKSQQATGVLLNAEGTFSTIVLKGYDPSKVALAGDSEEVPRVLCHDPISRMTLLQLPKGSFDTADVEPQRAKSTILTPGDALQFENGGGRFVSFVRRHHGRVLPMTFMRVNYAGEKAPISGSRVYTMNKELVGLVYQSSGESKSIYVLPIEVITNLEAAVNDKREFRPCWIGVSMDSLSNAPTVLGVRPETPAAKAGIKKEDVILSIDGEQVSSYPEVVNAFYLLKPGKETVFKILRGTEVKLLTIVPEINPVYVPLAE